MSFLNVLVQIARPSIWFITIPTRIAHPFMYAKNMLFKVMFPIEDSTAIATWIIYWINQLLSTPRVPSALTRECLDITTRRWNLIHSHRWTTTHNQAIVINRNMDFRSKLIVMKRYHVHPTLYFQTRMSNIITSWAVSGSNNKTSFTFSFRRYWIIWLCKWILRMDFFNMFV